MVSMPLKWTLTDTTAFIMYSIYMIHNKKLLFIFLFGGPMSIWEHVVFVNEMRDTHVLFFSSNPTSSRLFYGKYSPSVH